MHGFAGELEDLSSADTAAGGIVQRSAQGFARRRTGAMRASIQVKTTDDGATVTAGVGITRPYPSVQEFGSTRRHITANRYMARAAQTQERPVATVYDNAIQHAADKVKGV